MTHEIYNTINKIATKQSDSNHLPVFNDSVSKELLQYIQKIAPSDANILINGETGTGKELIARTIHHHSHRKNKPFIAVNCGALSESLVESELFGHEKGAFTGALSSRAGWFEVANGGTLLLDEIGDLSKRIQVKLLRVLQEREFVRLGSRKTIPVDVRVLAATNVDLERAILEDNFREDLYYRLNVVSLNINPLRQRKGDILPLARHFLEKYAQQLGYQKVSLSKEAQDKLVKYNWPGNIRELENIIHHALLINQDKQISADNIHLKKLSKIQITDQLDDTSNKDQPVIIDPKLKEAFQALFQQYNGQVYSKFEEQLIRVAYYYSHENQVKTAQLLGLSRNVIRSRLIELGELTKNKKMGKLQS